jgi:hypothetical protein
MGYLHVDNSTLPDFTKAIISVWFRVPQFSAVAAKAVSDDWYSSSTGKTLPPPLLGIVPLVVLGPDGSFQDAKSTDSFAPRLVEYPTAIGPPGLTQSISGDTTLVSDTRPAFNVEVIVTRHDYNEPGPTLIPLPPETFYGQVRLTAPDGPPQPTNPTVIGIDCTFQDPAVYVNFQTNEKGSAANYAIDTQSITPGTLSGGYLTFPRASYLITTTFQGVGQSTTTEVLDPPHDVTIGSAPVTIGPTYNQVDVSNIALSTTAAITTNASIVVEPDVWNHLLVSIDLETMATHGFDAVDTIPPYVTFFDSWSNLYIALNDKNYIGFDLTNNWTENPNEPNATVNDDALSVADSPSQGDQNSDPSNFGYFPKPTYRISDPTVPCSDEPMGLPATTKYVKDIYDVDMAEFQMWVGQSIDTADEAMRRLFVAPDKKGRMTPVKPSVAAAKLGQPDILIHRTGNWEKGKNTGKIGLNFDGSIKQSGQFVPKGTIIKFRPDPILTGDPVKPKNPRSLG